MSERYRSISVKTELADFIEQYINANPQHGYRSISQFMEDATRRRLEELKVSESQLPRMEQVNSDENGVKIFDRQLRKVVDVHFKPSGITCTYDQTSDCEHVRFALAQPNIQDIIRRKKKEGWKL